MERRATLGRMENPVRGFLHGGAAVAGAVAVLVLVPRIRAPRVVAVSVFGVSLVAMYVVSGLYHSVPWSPRWKARLQRLDHSMIYLLIAGTYTPIAAVLLDGGWRVITLVAVWAITLTGITLKLALPRPRIALSVSLQAGLGWAGLVLLGRIAPEIGLGGVLLALAGGVSYTLGMVFLVTKRPRLVPSVFSYHEVFHLLTVTGSALHFVLIARYVAFFGG